MHVSGSATHASRNPRNCGPFAFISVIMRSRAEVRCSTRCTRACCMTSAEFSRQGAHNADKPNHTHLASDGWTAIGWHVCSLSRHQCTLPAEQTIEPKNEASAHAGHLTCVPYASCGHCDCLRLNRPRALAIIAGELAGSNDTTSYDLHRRHALAPAPR